MQNRTPAFLSAIATFILLVIGGLFFSFVQMVALNGVMDEAKAFRALGMGAVCQGLTMLLAAVFAGWFANNLIYRFDWNKTMAVIVSAGLGTLIGLVVAFIFMAISIPLAGVR